MVVEGTRHVDVSLGMWPVYIMLGGIADIAKRARRLYADPTTSEDTPA